MTLVLWARTDLQNIFCVLQKKDRFETAWGWGNDHRSFIFGWTIPLRLDFWPQDCELQGFERIAGGCKGSANVTNLLSARPPREDRLLFSRQLRDRRTPRTPEGGFPFRLLFPFLVPFLSALMTQCNISAQRDSKQGGKITFSPSRASSYRLRGHGVRLRYSQHAQWCILMGK